MRTMRSHPELGDGDLHALRPRGVRIAAALGARRGGEGSR
jgi:hypothetical protein